MELIEPIINDAPQHAAFCALTHLNRTPVAAGGSNIGTGGTKTGAIFGERSSRRAFN